MDVYIEGKQKIRLTQNEFRAQGGEGSVYVKDGSAYKIYADTKHMVPAAKINQLATMQIKNVLAPKTILTNNNRDLIGYQMAYAADTLPLSRTFPRAFRDRMGITPDVMLFLVRRMQETISHIHQHTILLVDINETNFLIDTSYQEVYFIDVDSYQTTLYPATALMESVRDRHNTAFSPGTDWFSFAIVSFQMFTGIHPYKGKHPTLKTLDDRMTANVSVLNPDVSVPDTCLPWDVIPAVYRQWYKAVLDDGHRIPPPDSLTTALSAIPWKWKVIKNTDNQSAFNIEELCDYQAPITKAMQGLIITANGIEGVPLSINSGRIQAAVIEQTQRPVALSIVQDELVIYDIRKNAFIQCKIAANKLMTINGRAYIQYADQVLELDFIETQTEHIFVTAVPVMSILPYAAELFEGVVIQNLLDTCYAYLLTDRKTCRPFRINEMHGRRIIDARYANKVLIVAAEKDGIYDRFVIRFDHHFQGYDIRHIENVSIPTVNFTVLDTGICLHMNDDDLEVFRSERGSSSIQVFHDSAISGDSRLFHNGAQALFARGSKLYKFSMRKEASKC